MQSRTDKIRTVLPLGKLGISHVLLPLLEQQWGHLKSDVARFADNSNVGQLKAWQGSQL